MDAMATAAAIVDEKLMSKEGRESAAMVLYNLFSMELSFGATICYRHSRHSCHQESYALLALVLSQDQPGGLLVCLVHRRVLRYLGETSYRH